MLKASLQLRHTQSLTLTPQLQQTIRLLQYSTLDLQGQIQEMMEQNPMLEAEELEPASEANQENGTAKKETQTTTETQETQPLDETRNIPDELPLDTQWDSIYESAPKTHNPEFDPGEFLENQAGNPPDLHDHLLSQVYLMPLSENDQMIAELIVLNINDSGYLIEPIESVHESLPEELEIGLDEVKVIQHLIMQLDPIGCGASNACDSLLTQLRNQPGKTTTHSHAILLLEKYLPLLEKQNLKVLSSKSGLSHEEIEAAMTLIRSLNPRPGSGMSNSQADYVIPDVYVTQENGVWRASINPDLSPRLRIHPFYSTLIRRGDKGDDNRYMREQLQEARWFIKSIQSRNDTILRVAEVIVEKQQSFFEFGEEAMRPMVLRDIAEVLEMHESTISRVTTQKYMLTPKGLVEFKYFFSSQVNTADGGNASATAIRAIIRSLISDENPQKPLSDSKITSILLNEKGIKVARRTVAKYREAMSIPPSNERKRIA